MLSLICLGGYEYWVIGLSLLSCVYWSLLLVVCVIIIIMQALFRGKKGDEKKLFYYFFAKAKNLA